MTPGEWIGAAVGLLFFIYIAARLAGKAWYRSRRQHLSEMAKLFGNAPPPSKTHIPRIKLKPGDNNGH